MANPLKDWQHGRTYPRLDPEANIIALKCAPSWDAKSELWRTIMSKKILTTTDTVPKVVDLMFGWDGTTYITVAQETIADTEMLRALEYKHRKSKVRRAYFYVYFEELDPHIALLKGIRQRGEE